MELSGTINRSITLSGSMIARGLDGRGIVSIAKTGTSGLVDTYTITYTDETTSTFTVTNGANGQITATSFAEEFSSSKAYAVGDYVVYSGQLYQFTTAHAAGAWNASHATAVQIADQVSELKSAISEETRNLFDINLVPSKNGITNVNGVLRGTAGSFNTGYGPSTAGITSSMAFETNTQYVISFEAKNEDGGTGNGLTFAIFYSDSTAGNIVCPLTDSEFTRHYAVTTSGKTVSKMCISYYSEGGKTWQIRNIQIEKGTTLTPYIQHLTADDIIARNEIADLKSSDNDILSQINTMNSRDVFHQTKAQKTESGVTFKLTDGVLTASGTATAQTYYDLVSDAIGASGLEAGERYFVHTGLRNANKDGFITIYLNTGSGNYNAYDEMVGDFVIEIPAECVSLIIRYYARSGSVISVNTKITFSKAQSNDRLLNYADFRFLRAFGTGDCTIIKFNDGTSLVIDFGINEQQGTLQNSWATAISELGITHIDYAIISHYHGDHLGMLFAGISLLIDSSTVFFLPNGHAFTQEELDALAWVDSQSGDTIVSNYNNTMSILDAAGCELVYPAEDDVWFIGGAEVRFWNADQAYIMEQFIAHTMYDYNNASLCNYITFGDYRLCFSGDIGLPVMEKYKKTVLSSQIFKVNHHSNGYNVVPLFLNSMMPKLDISMLGYNLAIGTLGSNANQAWCEQNNVPNVVTGINQKTISLRVSGRGYNFTTACRKLVCADEGIS